MLIIHDKRLPFKYKKALLGELPNAVLQPFEVMEESDKGRVYKSILHHPDIYLFQLDEKTIIYDPLLTGKQLESLKERDIELIKGEGSPYGKYPNTVRFNAARVGRFVFHNFNFTDPVILKFIEKKGLMPLNVTQGYARCSILIASNEAIITEDRGIFDSAKEAGLDALFLSTRFVLLPGERYGFIGGSSARTCNGTVVMLGDIENHPEFSKIEKFFNKHEVCFIYLKDIPLYDAGGLIVVSA